MKTSVMSETLSMMDCTKWARTGLRRIFPLLLSCLWQLGCQTRRSDPPNLERVLQAFAACSQHPVASSPQVPPVEIVIDDSESMRGYVEAPNSAYRRLVTKLLQKSIASGYTVRIGGFADLRQSEPLETPLSTVLSRSFYRRADTPLAALFTRIASPKGQKIYIVVSDMVQSETGRDSLALTGAFRSMIGAAPAIALYGFRSAFRGTYFVESEPKGKYLINVGDDGGKPFYMLILAPSADSLQQFERYAGIGPLTSGSDYNVVQFQTFYPSESPIEIGAVNFVPPAPPVKSGWLGENPLTWKCGGGDSVRVDTFRQRDQPAGRSELVFSIQAVAKQPVILPNRYRVEIEKADIGPKSASVAPARVATVEVAGKLGEASCTVIYRFAPTVGHQWDIYRVRIRAGAGNLGLPAWVRDWSTSDDHADQKRTLNLATIIEAMVRSSSENVVFFDHVIELHGGKS